MSKSNYIITWVLLSKAPGPMQSKILTTTTRSPGASCCQCFSNDNKTRDLALRPLEYCASQCKHQEVMEIQPPGFFMSKPKQDLDKKEDMLEKEKGNHDNETSEACFWGKSPASFRVTSVMSRSTLMSTSWSCKVHERLKDVTGMETCHSPQE